MSAAIHDWRIQSTASGLAADPSELADNWVDVLVPGAVASVAERVVPPVAVADLDSRDWWFTTSVSVPDGSWLVRFNAVATLCEIWIDSVSVVRSDSMFVPVSFPIDHGDHVLTVVCRSVDTRVRTRRPRGRWRSSMISQQGLRWIRTSMLGRAPVFGRAPVPIGPYRSVDLVPRDRPDVRFWGEWVEGRAVLRIRGTSRSVLSIDVNNTTVDVPVDPGGTLDASIVVDGASQWWPHTHGDPQLYSVRVQGFPSSERWIGFRTVAFDAGTGTLTVNGSDVFCRGGCWVPLDPVGLQNDPDALRRVLTSIRDAGLNMIRSTGTMMYEDDAFFEGCSRLGIMVWQDVMLATIDPPVEPEFETSICDEVRNLLHSRVNEPSLVVLSGGSETYQQPTMLGVTAAVALLDEVLPALVANEAPGLPYVPSTPSGGDLHTHVGSAVAHYFGVGGYLRPLSDIRTAAVNFAAECLAFSVPPERRCVDDRFGSAAAAGHTPEWKAAVPRDRGSSWDFEDIRDHYVRTLFGVEPSLVRRDDPERYLDLGRAAICEAVTEAFSFWRGARSGCGGALVLTLRDLEPGAGWGFSDCDGTRKAPWYPLARACAPIAVLVTDEGMDGYRIEAVNDTAIEVVGDLTVTGYSATGAVAAQGSRSVRISARSSVVMMADALIGHFTDLTHAHRFGPRAFDAAAVTLVVDGEEVARTVQLIGGPALPLQHSVGLAAVARQVGEQWMLAVSADYAAQYVCVDVDGFDTSDSWFHLAAGTTRTVMLSGGADGRKPTGHVRALNAVARGRITIDG